MNEKFTERERLRRVCEFWLRGEITQDVKAPADFYGRLRDIYLLVDTADDSAIMIAIQVFDSLLLEVNPPQSWLEYEKRWRNEC